MAESKDEKKEAQVQHQLPDVFKQLVPKVKLVVFKHQNSQALVLHYLPPKITQVLVLAVLIPKY